MDRTDAILLSTALLLIVAMFALVGSYMSVQAVCLENGWAKAELTWNLRGYCIREENETEITVPVEQVVP